MRAVILLAAGLAACTPTVLRVPGVAEASPSQVAGCTLIGTVRGVPAVFGALRDIGLDEARRAAKKSALEAGADTVVFNPLPEGEVALEVSAKAYTCR